MTYGSASRPFSSSASYADATTQRQRQLPRLLLVDDDQLLLNGLRRQLHLEFDVETAAGGAECLERLAESGPFAVVLSDYQMPRMNGAAVLTAVREAAPDTTRMLLTGQADLADVARVVNEGGIFRFLLKPVRREELVEALHAGVEQHRLVTAEHDLLDRTLRGSVKALTELLSLACPAAFARATRMRRLAILMLGEAGTPVPWHVDLAIMLSQVGALALPPSVLERMGGSEPLSPQEQEMVSRLPAVADQVLADIPRLDEVRAAILAQDRPFYTVPGPARNPEPVVPFGARVLRLVRDYDALGTAGYSGDEAVQRLRARTHCYDPQLLVALASATQATKGQARLLALKVSQLGPLMVLAEDVCTTKGVKLILRGQDTTVALLERIRNFSKLPAGIQEPIMVYASAGASHPG